MNLDTLSKANVLHAKIKALSGKLSALKSTPHGVVDLNIMAVKNNRTYSEHVGTINMTSDSIDAKINTLMQVEFKKFKDTITEIISDELRDAQIEFDNLK